MQNQRLAKHSDKIVCAESETGYTPKSPQFIWPICSICQNILDMLDKKTGRP